ncbi:hypothetical protein [Sphingobacterium psychroaquaticum]|uniref:Uncharacterized protein n=1 Tax=Sphingobacterium psychroaquaticum TaxID=561061 RepID=A0A1X7KF05_9SPHI|nr:hypothetical protein [Sphingobacterium psychroaquaticum]QBQ42867.1 hypothetical protein E2P86_17665 [Sphingobacterium psychroaquaticum]SMG39716.1 hypothetical protein SAMN05660862_2806 [Sphingobacterium psychroaquaticum]
MKINPDMLHKYASGQCSEDEKLLVEKWLESDSWDSIEEQEVVAEEVGKSIWHGVSEQTVATRRISWAKITAAAAVLFILGFSFLHFRQETLDSLSFANESLGETKFFVRENYDVLLGGNSNVKIDLVNNKLLFSGDFILKPKCDFKLLDADQNTLVFKAGREYFVSDSPDFGKIVAFQKSDLAFLPSSMQIKIREQFQSI